MVFIVNIVTHCGLLPRLTHVTERVAQITNICHYFWPVYLKRVKRNKLFTVQLFVNCHGYDVMSGYSVTCFFCCFISTAVTQRLAHTGNGKNNCFLNGIKADN